MTANDDSPAEGQESIDTDGYPLRDASDEDLALALEGQKQEAKEAVDDVTRALLNDCEPLTDEKAQRVADAGDALTALWRTLTLRVPEEHRQRWQDGEEP